jgi:hypothetical protein
MSSLRRVSILGVFLLAAAWAAESQTNPKNMDPAPNPRGGPDDYGSVGYSPSQSVLGSGSASAHQELWQLWKKLPGRYEKNDEGSRLTVTLRATSPYVLFVEARTEAGGKESVERGWISLADVSTGYRSARVRFALAYRPDSLRNDFGCALYGTPTADGIAFESEGTDCSFAIGRRVSKVRVDATTDTISLSAEKDAEPAVLTRVPSR